MWEILLKVGRGGGGGGGGGNPLPDRELNLCQNDIYILN